MFNDIKKRIVYIYYILINTIQRIKMKSPNVKSVDQAIDLIINNKVSVSRFGDGEFEIIRGFENGFQCKNKELAKRLSEVINVDEEKIIICIPDVFNSLKKYKKDSKLFWIGYLDILKHRKEVLQFIKGNNYYDSFLTRPYMIYKDKSDCGLKFKKIKSIWEGRDLLIIEGENSRLGVGNNLFDNCKTIERLLCPSKNAFDKYEQILQYSTKQNKDKLVLIALGPTASVLAYDLSTYGYQAIDIGHIDIEYEWFLSGAKEKIKINNKHVNEVKDGYIVNDIENEDYRKQIKMVIKS